MPKYASYKFGAASAALLGIGLTSDGKITVFARNRPPAPAEGNPAPPMTDLYRSAALQMSGKGSVDFTLSLRETNTNGTPKEGLAAISPMIWPIGYPGPIFLSLGANDPLGAVDINYSAFGPVIRPANISSSRSVSFTFAYDPNAANLRDKAVLYFRDASGLLTEAYRFSSLENLPAAYAGIVASVQVSPDHYDDGCATLEFTSAQQIAVTSADGKIYSGLSKLVLNTTPTPQ